MQIDHVWHHRRANDARRQENALRTIEAGDYESLRNRHATRTRHHNLDEKPNDDDAQEPRNDSLKMAKPAARLQRQDGERANGRDQRGR